MRYLPLLAASVLLLAGCDHSSQAAGACTPAGPGLPTPGVQTCAAHADSARDDHVVSGGAVRSLSSGVFAMTAGTDVLQIKAADLGGDAYRLSTPDDARIRPTAALSDGTVFAGVANDNDGSGPAVVTAELSKAVTWRLRLDGGAKEELLDLTGAKVTRIDLTAGSSVVEATLPAPSGTTTVALAGGASQLTLHLAPQVPVRVEVGGGAGSVTIDGVRHTGVSGNTDYTPQGWSTATNRYDIDLTSGVSTLTIDRG